MGKHRETEEDIVHVDFDFFDLQEDDFLSIKNLLRQTFGADNLSFNLSDITQACLDGKGSTVKADDTEYNDVLAVLCAAKMDSKLKNEVINYYIEKLRSPESQRLLLQLRAQPDKFTLLLNERFLNMPLEIVVPLFTLLSQEAKGLPEYLLFPTRVYSEDVDKSLDNAEVFSYHLEDDVIVNFALVCESFEYTNRAIQGDLQPIKQFGKLLVLRTADIPKIIAQLGQPWF